MKQYGWSLNDIDDSNLETVFDFLLLEKKEDEDVMVIGGKLYKRAPIDKPPSWL